MALQQTLKPVRPDPAGDSGPLRSGRLSAGKLPTTSASPAAVSGTCVCSEGRRPDLGHPGGKFIFYRLDTSVLGEIMLWLQFEKGALPR